MTNLRTLTAAALLALAAAASPLAASGLDEGKFGANAEAGKYGRNLDDGKFGANQDEGKYGRNLDAGKFGAATFDGR
jgi:hypothetical protein